MDRIGPYEILDRIGTGGMGTVYRTRHSETGQMVALKVLRSDFADDSLYLRRFRREAEIARSLQSEHIVRTLDAGVDDGTPWIAMELVEGESLAALLRRRGALPADQAVDIALQVAEGLAVADESGVTHRDISPQNILITLDGTAKLADFGVARSETSATLTATAAFVGKPAYAAPEVFSGHADIRSDIYSLGAVLFETLTGRAVFIAASPMALMEMHQRQSPPKIGDLGVRVSPQLEAAVQRCLEKDPGRRYQAPGEFADALSGRAPPIEATTVLPDASTTGETVTMRPGGRGPPRDSRATAGGGFWRERWWMFASLGIAGFAAFVTIGVLGFAGAGNDESGAGSPAATAAEVAASGGPRIQAPTSLSVDVIPSGNTATSAGDVQGCASAKEDDLFIVDVVVTNVEDLLAWELPVSYDGDVLEVTGRDVSQQFQSANPGSQVLDLSDDVPDDDGRYELQAADTGDPPSPDSGSGTLVRLTLRAKGPGISPLSIAHVNIDDDDVPDSGILLRAASGILGDDDGDSIFDGPAADGEIRVGQRCTGADSENVVQTVTP